MEKANPFPSETVDAFRNSSETVPTLRFKLSLTDSDDKKCPEFSFLELVKNASAVSKAQVYQRSSAEQRYFYQRRTSLYCSLLKHVSDFWFPENYFLSFAQSANDTPEKIPWEEDGEDENLRALAKKFEEKYVSCFTFVRSIRFFVQRSRFLRNRSAIEAMKCVMLCRVVSLFWTGLI